MAGHSHWANISFKKGIVDKKRGKLFSKLARYIIVAARHGGGEPGGHHSPLRACLISATASQSRESLNHLQLETPMGEATHGAPAGFLGNKSVALSARFAR